MAVGELAGQMGKRGFALRSVQHSDARVRLLFQRRDLEVVAVEVGARASLAEPSLWGKSSWHLVVEGQAIFQQKGRRWELLPEEFLCLSGSAPYTIVNSAPEPVKLLTLLFKKDRSNRRRGGGRQ